MILSSEFPSDEVRVTQEVRSLCEWPSNSFSIGFYCKKTNLQEHPHTVLIFIPGNPGLIDWYISSFTTIVERLGRGYAAYGVSYAGHGLKNDIVDVERMTKTKGLNQNVRSSSIPWTVDGQVLHKIAFIDSLDLEFRNQFGDISPKPAYIFVSHSIGAHLTQRLCILRPDICERTKLLIHVTPFIRMKAPWSSQLVLDFVSRHPSSIIAVSRRLLRFFQLLPFSMVESGIGLCMAQDIQSRKITTKLLRQPEFAKNFFTLGLEEIREVPRVFDTSAMRFIGQRCPTAMLYGGNDHWAPKFHIDDLKELVAKNVICSNLTTTYEPKLRHDFVTDADISTPIVIEFCLHQVRRVACTVKRSKDNERLLLRSNL